MDGSAIVSVSAAVVGCVQLIKWRAWIPDKYGPIAVLIFSAAGVVFWGWSKGGIDRTVAFDYFAGWIAIATSASGVYGFTRASGEALTRMQAPPSGAGAEPTLKE